MTTPSATPLSHGLTRLELAGHVIDAVSVGGIETCFQVPAFDVCLDIGRCPPGADARSTLLLTHGHIDHAAGLPYWVSMRAMMHRSSTKVALPKAAAGPLGRILDAWGELQTDTDRVKLMPLEPGDTVPIRGGYARAFASPHRIACLGYTLYRQVHKLKPDLLGLSGAEIAARKRAGEVVHDTLERAELCFPGDTRIEVLEREPSVRAARVLLLECTFVGSDPGPERAREGGHVHLDQIAERAALFENEVVVLTHFSRRYHDDMIRAEVARLLPASLRERLVLLLPSRDALSTSLSASRV